MHRLEKEVAHEEDKARMLADHAEALRASDLTLTNLQSQSQRAEAAHKAKQSECTKLKDDLENASSLAAKLQAEYDLLTQTHSDQLDRYDELRSDKKKTQSALEAHKSELAQSKRELEMQKVTLDEYRRDMDAYCEDLAYHKQMVASQKSELRQHQQDIEQQASVHAQELEQQRAGHINAQRELERAKDREIEEARALLKGSVQALERQLSELQRQLQIEREIHAENEQNHTKEMEVATARYDDARRRHEVTVAEHLQAEELLWKERESLSRDHEQSSRTAMQLEEKLKELKMVHTSEQARSAAEVDIAKQDLAASRKQCDKLQETVANWERKYMGAVDSHSENRDAWHEERTALKSEVRMLEHRVSEVTVDLQAKEAKWAQDQQKHVEDTLELRAEHKIALDDAHRRSMAAIADAENRYDSAMAQLHAAIGERDSMTTRMRAFHESLLQSRDKDFAAMLATAEETSNGFKAAMERERRKVHELEDAAAEMTLLIDAQARKLSEHQDVQQQVERLQKQKQELVSELENAMKTIEVHQTRAEQSLEAHVALQVENSSLSMNIESVRKQWSEETETLQSEVEMWKVRAAEHEAQVVRICAEEDALKSLLDNSERSLLEQREHRERLESLVVKLKEELVVATSTSLIQEREIGALRDKAAAVAAVRLPWRLRPPRSILIHLSRLQVRLKQPP